MKNHVMIRNMRKSILSTAYKGLPSNKVISNKEEIIIISNKQKEITASGNLAGKKDAKIVTTDTSTVDVA